MIHNKLNRQVKDSLFTFIFGEHPENALSLYNAINKTNYTNVEGPAEGRAEGLAEGELNVWQKAELNVWQKAERRVRKKTFSWR